MFWHFDGSQPKSLPYWSLRCLYGLIKRPCLRVWNVVAWQQVCPTSWHFLENKAMMLMVFWSFHFVSLSDSSYSITRIYFWGPRVRCSSNTATPHSHGKPSPKPSGSLNYYQASRGIKSPAPSNKSPSKTGQNTKLFHIAGEKPTTYRSLLSSRTITAPTLAFRWERTCSRLCNSSVTWKSPNTYGQTQSVSTSPTSMSAGVKFYSCAKYTMGHRKPRSGWEKGMILEWSGNIVANERRAIQSRPKRKRIDVSAALMPGSRIDAETQGSESLFFFFFLFCKSENKMCIFVWFWFYYYLFLFEIGFYKTTYWLDSNLGNVLLFTEEKSGMRFLLVHSGMIWDLISV